MILDADMTVPPEDLPKFYAAAVAGIGDNIHGTRARLTTKSIEEIQAEAEEALKKAEDAKGKGGNAKKSRKKRKKKAGIL